MKNIELQVADLESAQQEGFEILKKYMPEQEAVDMIQHFKFQIFRDVKSLADVGRQVKSHEPEFKYWTDEEKASFDYEAFGKQMDEWSEYYEDFENGMLLEIFN